MSSFEIIPGDAQSTVILHVPHSSTFIPADVRAGIVLTDEELAAETEIFETWMRDGSPSPQQRLRIEIHHTDVRREAQRAAAGRSQARRAQE